MGEKESNLAAHLVCGRTNSSATVWRSNLARSHLLFHRPRRDATGVQQSGGLLDVAYSKSACGLFYLNDDTSNPANAIPLRNPIIGKTYLGVIPASDMILFAKNVLAGLPATTAPGLGTNFITTPRGTIQDDKGDVRQTTRFRDA